MIPYHIVGFGECLVKGLDLLFGRFVFVEGGRHVRVLLVEANGVPVNQVTYVDNSVTVVFLLYALQESDVSWVHCWAVRVSNN